MLPKQEWLMICCRVVYTYHNLKRHKEGNPRSSLEIFKTKKKELKTWGNTIWAVWVSFGWPVWEVCWLWDQKSRFLGTIKLEDNYKNWASHHRWKTCLHHWIFWGLSSVVVKEFFYIYLWHMTPAVERWPTACCRGQNWESFWEIAWSRPGNWLFYKELSATQNCLSCQRIKDSKQSPSWFRNTFRSSKEREGSSSALMGTLVITGLDCHKTIFHTY